MGLLDMIKTTPEVGACDKELSALEQRRNEIYLSIGKRYAEELAVSQGIGTPYEASLSELSKMAARTQLLEKRKLAIQGQRRCEKCGNILSLDSVFCNSCGEKLLPIAPEVLTDGPLCPQCKEPVEPGVLFCRKCGAKLGEAVPETVQPAGPVCSSCGAVCKPGAKFCAKCGHAL